MEIIIYRQLLSAAGIETQTQTTTTTTTAVIPRVEQVVHEQSGKLVIKRQKRGPVGISKNQNRLQIEWKVFHL